jgi:Holliday junction resolvase|tara:strand:+ start:245 stop:508 length:264 start_codon:yes stop_codon:yes gene_type:complete
MASKFQTKIIKEYESKGYFVINLIKTNKNGITDLLCMRSGEVVFIEVKEANDTLKPLQKFRIDELIDNGFTAFCLKKGKGIIYPLNK